MALLLASVAIGLAQSPAGMQGVRLHGDTAIDLTDPFVKTCFTLAAPQWVSDPAPTAPAVDRAAITFDFDGVFDAVASCRAGLARSPHDRRLILAEDHVSTLLTTLVVGLPTALSDEKAFAAVLERGRKPETLDGFNGKLVGFFLGSAYEYGVGTTSDRAAAIRWYAVGAAAGSAVSTRELTRLQQGQP